MFFYYLRRRTRLLGTLIMVHNGFMWTERLKGDHYRTLATSRRRRKEEVLIVWITSLNKIKCGATKCLLVLSMSNSLSLNYTREMRRWNLSPLPHRRLRSLCCCKLTTVRCVWRSIGAQWSEWGIWDNSKFTLITSNCRLLYLSLGN